MTNDVTDWAADYDIFDSGYVADPFSIWDELREGCPIGRTERYGGSWLPTRYADVTAIARDVTHFSSRHVGVLAEDQDTDDLLPAGIPPISANPPMHTWSRCLLLPWFSNRRVDEYEVLTRNVCRRLVSEIVDRGAGDAAAEYAQQIPVRVIAVVLGVPEDMADTFTGWVRDILEFGYDVPRGDKARGELLTYFLGEMEQRRTQPGGDLISSLLHEKVDWEPIPDGHILGTVALTLIAGVDTTWSAIGSASRLPIATARRSPTPTR